MTTSNEHFAPGAAEPTTALPYLIGLDKTLPELTSPQERYDHGFKRGYMAGYAEGARQAQAERAADLASQKATWAAAQARAGAMVSQLASATEEYLAHFGPRDGVLTEQLIRAAFELAEAVVTCELRTSPDLAIEVAKRVLATLPTGPAVVRVNPGDEELLREAAGMLGTSRGAVTVMADPVVGPGGCIVTSGAKTVDARIEEALARARAALCSPADPLTSSYDGAAGYGAAGYGAAGRDTEAAL
jgi:flagellar assembly protein FliH